LVRLPLLLLLLPAPAVAAASVAPLVEAAAPSATRDMLHECTPPAMQS
jgi:hypothetical protein